MLKSIVPPSGVYLMALDIRLVKICCRRRGSPMMSSWTTSLRWTCNVCFFCFKSGCSVKRTFSTSSARLNSLSLTESLPLSILDMSSTSLMRSSNRLDDLVILFRHSNMLSALCTFALAISVMPTIPFMGVRISCDMLDKNSLLAWFAWFALSQASFKACVYKLSFSRASVTSLAMRSPSTFPVRSSLVRIIFCLMNIGCFPSETSLYSRSSSIFPFSNNSWKRSGAIFSRTSCRSSGTTLSSTQRWIKALKGTGDEEKCDKAAFNIPLEQRMDSIRSRLTSKENAISALETIACLYCASLSYRSLVRK